MHYSLYPEETKLDINPSINLVGTLSLATGDHSIDNLTPAIFSSRRFSILRISTHWGRVTYICVSKLTFIGSNNGLSPDRRQAIILTNAGLLLIGPLGTKFNEILIEILTFSFKRMRLKVSSAKRRPFCLGLNVLIHVAICSGSGVSIRID